jgi:hypothetical protein
MSATRLRRGAEIPGWTCGVCAGKGPVYAWHKGGKVVAIGMCSAKCARQLVSISRVLGGLTGRAVN